MYAGSASARAVIRDYEFYFPKNRKKNKKKKTSQIFSESKQERIKFDVLLTSYEMINMDTTTLKGIKWECMVRDFCLLLIMLIPYSYFCLNIFNVHCRLLMKVTVSRTRIQSCFLH